MAGMAKFEKLFSGTMGHFWVLDENADPVHEDSISGYVKLGDRGYVEIDTLDEDPFDADVEGKLERTRPRAIYGVTVDTPVLLFQVDDAGGTEVLGGAKASVRRYRAYSAAISALGPDLKSISVKEVEIFFPGIEQWAGVQVSEENAEYFDDRRLKGFTLKVENAAEEVVGISDGREVAVSSHWSIAGPRSRRSIFAPVSIICRSESPVELWDLLQPIFRIQELISIAYDGFVVAEGGVIDFDMASKPPTRPPFWNYFLMHVPNGVRVPKSLGEKPMFWLGSLGDASILARWIELCDSHPRLVKPISNFYRRGAATPELRLMEAATAMEYWCSAIKKKPGYEWAKASKGEYPALVIAKHLGEGFSSWVGNAEAWADLFWSRYNKLKHEPSFKVDEGELSFLASIGFRLLVAEVLSEVAGDVKVGALYLRNWRIDSLGGMAKNMFPSKSI
ncbi:hypothetical protein [Saccharothrix algeriensis]|uniref:ApeA N-terminal domain-containing protein n=1 Tax=Saccharothrix algeriensis TaxID=173560 RepID=A0ABS2SCM7_9PSEU|nr:hypothetical protein [Saccharothrix algeriensis]MBM7813705.1 hypothetical protein [Saccharothrix algeriensis]